MLEFGSIVLARFPFTDFSGEKLRPALIISRDNERRSDVVLGAARELDRVTGHLDRITVAGIRRTLVTDVARLANERD